MYSKLQRYALIAEIVGAIAVVLSLVYVGVGIRQNTEVVQVANHHALVEMDMEKNAWLRDREFAETWVLAQNDFSKLTEAQRRQYTAFIADTLNAWEFAYITYANGAMAENIWIGWDGFYRSEMGKESFQSFWQAEGSGFSPRFKSYIDTILRNFETDT